MQQIVVQLLQQPEIMHNNSFMIINSKCFDQQYFSNSNLIIF